MLLKEKWRNAFIDWQKAAPYDFGPAEEGSIGLNTIFKDITTFPINVGKLEAAIDNGDLIDIRTKQTTTSWTLRQCYNLKTQGCA